MTSNIYKPVLMKQLFELGCSYSAEILSLTKLLGQLQDSGNVTTLASYLEILDQSVMLTGLQKFANDEARKRGSVPKYQVYNNALLTAYRGRTFEMDRTDARLWGRWWRVPLARICWLWQKKPTTKCIIGARWTAAKKCKRWTSCW